MRILYVALLSALTSSATVWAQSNYPQNAPPLERTPYIALPLGSVHAQGWLHKELELQRDGLTGHAEQTLTEIGPSSAWLGGDQENWEKSPYYVKGLVSLAYTLDDPSLKQRAQKWVDWALQSQKPDGSYGPTQNDDWWPRMVSNYYLRDYYEATSDARVPPLLSRYYHYMLLNLPKRPLDAWGKSRAGDDIDTAIWLYNRTHEPFLIELIDLLRKQAYDWPTIFTQNTFQSFGRDFQPKHNVNVAQALKMPAVWWQRSGKASDRDAAERGYQNLMDENGLSLGIQSGTEFLSGRSPGQGVEFCSIVEQMLSEETIARILGQGRDSDRLEQLAFNALPAAWNRDLTALRYYTLPNHVIAKIGPHGWGQDYGNGPVYGPRSGYPCCCFNVHQGWPKFVQNSWAATNDGGLAAIAYGPTVVNAKVANGVDVSISEETDYPFGDELHFRIDLKAPTTFPLSIRTPGWCDQAALSVDGETIKAAKPGQFIRLNRRWQQGDEVVLKLPMKVMLHSGIHNTRNVHRGPLIYALQIDSDKNPIDEPAKGYPQYEQSPTTAWNYALQPKPGVELLQDVKPAKDVNPFTPENVPVKLKATARKLPEWGLALNGTVALDPPVSPVSSKEPAEAVTLVPLGSEDLRVTDFPVLDSTNAAKLDSFNYDFKDNRTTGLYWIGGDWWAHDGALRTTNTDGPSGFKALVDNVSLVDLQMSADVTPPPTGDAGIIFRVTHAAVGPDAFEGYYAGISASGHEVVLGYSDGSAWHVLKRVPRDVPAKVFTHLGIVARGNQIEVRVGGAGTPVIAVDDDHWKAGEVGVRMYTNDKDHATAEFTHLKGGRAE